MATIILVTDLPASIQDHELVKLMIDGLNAKASRVAPCLTSDEVDLDLIAEAKLILVGVVKRWIEAGAGSVVQQTVGPWSQTIDTKQRPGWNLWPSEITQLQDLCKSLTGDDYKPFMIDMTGLSSSSNPLSGAVINTEPGHEPQGQVSPNALETSGELP